MTSVKLKRTFRKFYYALPITSPRFIKDEKLKELYEYIYKGNTHNLSLAGKLGVGIFHAPLSAYKGLKESYKQLRKNGNTIKEAHGVSKFSQLKSLLFLAFVKKTPPDYYYSKKAYSKKDLKLSENYLINKHLISIHSRLLARTTHRGIINNKIEFYKHCQIYKDQLLTIIGIAKEGKFYFLSGFNKFPKKNLFLKPTEGNGGRNCYAINWSEKGYDMSILKFPVYGPGLQNILSKNSHQESLLLQYQYSNCKEMENLSSGALITSRVTSYIDVDRSIKFFFSCLMMPTGNIVVSNGVHGGILAKIDFETGILGPAYRLEDEETELHIHPNTGAKITGFKLPFWEEVIKMCQKFHALFPDIPSIGWDVCYTDEGPKIIEGNLSWPVEIWELTDKDFNPSEYIRVMNHHIQNFKS